MWLEKRSVRPARILPDLGCGRNSSTTRVVPRNCHCLGHLPRVPTEDGPYIGIALMVIGFLSWNAGGRRLGSSGAMVFYNTLPLYGALLGHLFLGESIGPARLLGGALIIGGGLWAARGRSLDR